MIGEVVGSYRIVRKLGEGGMGVVYLAEHTILGRPAAVKMLLPQLSGEPEVLGRFFNEALAASRVQHAGLVNVFDYGQHGSGSAYLIMEYLVGMTLSQRIDSHQAIPLDLLATIGRQIASAVGAAHAQGIVHRDLKPDNVFLVADPDMPLGLRVKILDFGIAKLTSFDGTSGVKTLAGEIFGTPSYMSPEQCKGAALVDHRSDIYSLGCMLYEMACGRAPFVAPGSGEIMAAHIFQRPSPAAAVRPDLPAVLDDVVLRMLSKPPEQRPQTMREVMAEMDRLVAPGEAAAAPLPDAPRPRSSFGPTLFEARGDPTERDLAPPVHAPPAPATPGGAPRAGAAPATGAGWFFPRIEPDDLMRQVDQLRARPARVLPYLIDGHWHLAAVLVRDPSLAWCLEIGADAPTLTQRLTERRARLVDLASFGEGAARRYAAVLVEHRDQLPCWWEDGLDAASLQVELDARGAEVVDLDTYTEGEQRRFAAVLRPRGGAPSWWFPGLDPQQLHERLVSNGARPTCLRSYVDGGAVKFACAMVKGGDVSWWLYIGVDAATVAQRVAEHQARIIDLDVFVQGSDPRFSVILNQP